MFLFWIKTFLAILAIHSHNYIFLWVAMKCTSVLNVIIVLLGRMYYSASYLVILLTLLYTTEPYTHSTTSTIYNNSIHQCDVTYLSPQLSLILAVGNSNRSLSSLLDVITEKRSRQTPSSILGLHNGHNGFGGLVCLVMLACLQSGKCSRIVLCSSRFIWSTFPSEFRLREWSQQSIAVQYIVSIPNSILIQVDIPLL